LGRSLLLTCEITAKHLEGRVTIGLYAINPQTQRCKWVAIDADYEDSLEHLLKLQWELKGDGIEAALEKSRRGGHLWILAETPLLAKDCRIYVHNLAARLKLPVKGTGLPEGIEVFPRHDALKPGPVEKVDALVADVSPTLAQLAGDVAPDEAGRSADIDPHAASALRTRPSARTGQTSR
jgi:hypothetical protein